jgi:hypothetical protein
MRLFFEYKIERIEEKNLKKNEIEIYIEQLKAY